MKWGLLEFQDIGEPSIQNVTLNLRELYGEELGGFEERWVCFKSLVNSDRDTAELYEDAIKDGFLTYETESLLPDKKSDQKTSLLLLLGNPASHSVRNRMFFSFEKKRGGAKKEHRFWKILAESGIFAPSIEAEDLDERNRIRKQKLRDLSYLDHKSPFQIGLAVFYSMPSAASGKWSGVAGLRRLFGTGAFRKITCWERQRVENLISEFVAPNGIVVVFQKDAYTEIKSDRSPDYSYNEAKAGKISGQCRCNLRINLHCLAPTRLMRTNFGFLKTLAASYF